MALWLPVFSRNPQTGIEFFDVHVKQDHILLDDLPAAQVVQNRQSEPLSAGGWSTDLQLETDHVMQFSEFLL